jgi:hypothetical protein
MKRWSGVAILAALLVAALPMLAQGTLRSSGPGSYGQGYGSNYIPDGTRFVVVLDNKLDSNKLEAGKGFKAKLGEDLAAPNGDVIPRGNRIKGHVSSVDSGFHGRLLLSFDSVETRHGWVPLAATVTDVPGEHGMKISNEGEVQKTTNGQRTVETAAAGAVVGAGTGAIAGGGHGALIGAAVGGAVGGTAGLLTGRDIHLNKGQQLELVLDRPLQVPAQ